MSDVIVGGCEVVYKSLDFLGFPDHRVGDDGSVWSKAKNWRGGIWRPLKTSFWGGYLIATFNRKGQQGKTLRVHNLVLFAFVGPRQEGMEGCHNDGDRTNNHLKNLRWDTHSKNNHDKIKHGTNLPGEKNPKAKLTEDQVKEIRKLYATKLSEYSQSKLGKRFGVGQDQISSIVRRESWRHVQ